MTIGGGTAPKGVRRVKALLIDLDDTLYRCHQIPASCRSAIEAYIHQHLSVPLDEVPQLTSQLYFSHGTTLAGLVASGYKIDYDHWHQLVHHEAIDYSLLKPDPVLRNLLCSIDIPKFILTNADRKHAQICLDRLGLSDCFKAVYDFEWVMAAAEQQHLIDPGHAVLCKPSPQVYHLVLAAMHCTAQEVIFFDDSARNVAAAHSLGMTTVLVGQAEPVPGSNMCLLDMHQLPSLLPELVDQPGLVHAGHNGELLELVEPLQA